MSKLQYVIESAFDGRFETNFLQQNSELLATLEEVIALLDQGKIRVAEPTDNNQWKINEWIKKAILLYFRLNSNQLYSDSISHYFDKIPLKYQHATTDDFTREKVRVVPGAIIRRGAYLAENIVAMPSFVNIGAYIDQGTLIDTWATVGSCAQIGKNVHISGGAGIGGVLEPLQENPTIIEDNCFIGARSEIVEGVIIERGSVISMGVFLGKSTKIYDRATQKISYGRIPAGSVVIPGSLPAQDGSHSLYCAVIVKHVDEQTRAKVALNQILRDIEPETI